ncbi:hypothetical protein F4V57_08965 [Acinetobacter qingfengensis]|uniref:Uncharacterized protein n=1 Tax=Acinetobacter qingfengensis TaxID=1262585 RepID=A0A1E7RFV1_9GAMM|nr:hypothetical protein [Acinetobacter qingfengensis]KAA8732686.1 hypothetical protein F4V57_08965 [Acinetobacter qingfengensis]OEY98201.1 hypothetical protein BJI46_01380 [Acinetobacter qingfengensis]
MALGFLFTPQQAIDNFIQFARNAEITALAREGKYIAFLIILNISENVYLKNLNKVGKEGVDVFMTEIEIRITRYDFKDTMAYVGNICNIPTKSVVEKTFDQLERIVIIHDQTVFTWSF